MSRVCCVCTESKDGSDNPLFRCGGQPGQGCGIIVHQGEVRKGASSSSSTIKRGPNSIRGPKVLSFFVLRKLFKFL